MQTSFFGDTIDVSGVSPKGEFEPLPQGWYVATLTDIETRKKEGVLSAKCKFKIVDGNYNGRTIFENNLVMSHPHNQMAHDIAQRRLRSWADSLGVDPSTLRSADPFLGQTVRVKVSVQPAREHNGRQYDPSNRIDAFAAYDGMPTEQPVQAPRPPVAAPVARPPVQNAAPVQQQRPAAPVAPVANTPAPQRLMPWNKKS